jgi:heparan-alpha-glucosaminide N-acetyltransferase
MHNSIIANIDSSGLFLNNGHDVAHWRIPGVLQYFGFSYIVVSLIVGVVPTLPRLFNSARPTSDQRKNSSNIPLLADVASVNCAIGDAAIAVDDIGTFSDIKPHALQWIAALFLPITYIALAWGVTVPGCPTGYLGPGGYADQGAYFNCTGGSVCCVLS